MIRSMTGFGEAERSTAFGTVRVEIRTVNHRHFHVNFRTPTSLAAREGQVREWLRGTLSRGHVNCTVQLGTVNGAAVSGYRLDVERVGAQIAALREAAERFALPGTVDVGTLAGMRDLLAPGDPAEVVPPPGEDELREVVEEAARRTARMRQDEGLRLAADLAERCAAVAAGLDVIEERAPARLIAERDRLRAAVAELAGGVGIGEERLAQEVAFLAERWDINEELVRFRSHLELFRELLDGDAAEPVGKRMAFLVQEMHREANTIGSKANDAGIAHRVIAIKDEVEKLREQVENVE